MSATSSLSSLLHAFPGATLEEWEPDGVDLGSWAVAYARAGVAVVPLAPRAKVPAIPKAAGGRGVLDASADVAVVARWWGRADPARRTGPGCNIGARVPAGAFILDVDPRHDGLRSLAALEAELGPLPATRTTISGRDDGGRHFWFKHPGGQLSARRLGPGLDLKVSSGYVVLPPSVHPATGEPYRWADPGAPIAAPPEGLVERLRPEVKPPAPTRPPTPWLMGPSGESPADWFCANRRWADVLTGWTVVAGDGESDGSGWRHPEATSPLSATVRHGLLFVYTTSTPLEPTEPGSPHGYTKFRAWAELEHGGDMSAAARAVLERRRSTT